VIFTEFALQRSEQLVLGRTQASGMAECLFRRAAPLAKGTFIHGGVKGCDITVRFLILRYHFLLQPGLNLGTIGRGCGV